MSGSLIEKLLSPARYAFLFAACAACASSPETGSGPDQAVQAADESLAKHQRHEAMLSGPTTVGTRLMEFDENLRIWSNYTLAGKLGNDVTRAQAVEDELRYKAKRHFNLLLEQLETGAPNNRRIAAMAIGFSGYTRSLSPLLSSLRDEEVDVVSNAVLGLAILSSSDTPPKVLLPFLETGRTIELRINAAWALRQLFEAGAPMDAEVRDTARRALADSEPGVRSQTCLLLASIGDTESIGRLTLLLADEVPLVAVAASRSLAYMGARNAHYEGACARALADSMEEHSEDTVRDGILYSLTLLSRRNYGRDAQEWQKWANGLD